MADSPSNMQKFVKSNAVKDSANRFLLNSIGVFMRDPVAALSMAHDLRNMSLTIRDGIFLECLETYILNSYSFNEETNQFETANLQSLAEALADVSPNAQAGYEGDSERLFEYAKRLVKLIDDCGSNQKAFYLASVTRALLSKQINTGQFFKLSYCIRNLTEEDLLFLKSHISEGTISRNHDYIDDYRALGLLYETDDGFSYTKRAFELKKFALCYEENIAIPDSFPERFQPIIAKPIPNEETLQLTQGGQTIKTSQPWATFG